MHTEEKRMFLLPGLHLFSIWALILAVGGGPVRSASGDPDLYYYSGGRKIRLSLSTEVVAVRFKEGATLEEQKAALHIEKPGFLLSQE